MCVREERVCVHEGRVCVHERVCACERVCVHEGVCAHEERGEWEHASATVRFWPRRAPSTVLTVYTRAILVSTTLHSCVPVYIGELACNHCEMRGSLRECQCCVAIPPSVGPLPASPPRPQ